MVNRRLWLVACGLLLELAMRLLNGLEGMKELPAGVVLSVGNFDGVHGGHRKIIEVARGLGEEVALVTFEPHPLTVLRPGAAPPRLTPLGMKNELLAELGVKYLVELPPTKEVLGVTAEDFWALIRDEVRPLHMVEGGTFNFGKGRGGTIEKLKEWAKDSAVKLHVIEPVLATLCDRTIVSVSSSMLRWLIGQGRMRDAAACLGRSYVVEGKVVKGYQRGRTIGVPTANLVVEGQMVPGEGVYAGRCVLGGKAYPAAVSVGRMPTFGENLEHQLEVYLVGFSGDLYGQVLRVEVVDFLRDQVKYDGVEALVRQIGRDVEETRVRVREEES